METIQIPPTCGSGSVGTNVVNELRSRGHEVNAPDHFNTERDGYIRSNVRNFRQLEKAFDGRKFDHVYYPAAVYGSWNGEDHYENLWGTNVTGTKHLLALQEMLKSGMISFSSSEVYVNYYGTMSEDVMVSHQINDTYQMNPEMNIITLLIYFIICPHFHSHIPIPTQGAAT